MIKKLCIPFLILLLVAGCGKTNLLQWAKPKDNPDKIALARQYLDEAKYDKAKATIGEPKTSEEKIIYAECLMGEANIDLSTIVKALTDDTVTNNYIIRLETLINDTGDRAKVIDAANLFVAAQPSETSDIIIGTLCTMIGHVAFLKNNFDPTNQGLLTVATSYNSGTTAISNGTNTYNVTVGDNVYPQYTTMGNPFLYIGQSAQLLASLKGVDKSVKEAVVSFNAAAEVVSENFNNTVTINVNSILVPVNFGAYHIFPWAFAKPLFLM